LHVNGYVNTPGTGSGYVFNSSGGGSYGSGNPTSIYTTHGVTSASFGFYATSDERIKKNVTKVSDTLDILNKLEVVRYQYKDAVKNGVAVQTGFIAQSVLGVYPNAIKTQMTDFIPDIYEKRSVTDGKITLDLADGTKVRIYDKDNKEHDLIVSNGSVDFANGDVFVYGTQVDDLLTLEKDALFSIAVGAIQELSAENTALKAQLAAMDARLAALEGTIGSRLGA
jgi:hypothetical protein